MKGLVIACVLVIGLAATSVSAATKCVSCVSSNPKCSDTYDTANNNALMSNCTYGCTKAKVNTNGAIVLTRGCALTKVLPKCDFNEVNLIFSIKTWSCNCDGDFCNSAPKMALPIAGLVTALIATLCALL